MKGRLSLEKDDFLKKLEKLVEHAKSKHNTLDAGEINDFFTGDNLSPEQMDQIYSYLENRNIDVVPVLDEAMLKDVYKRQDLWPVGPSGLRIYLCQCRRRGIHSGSGIRRTEYPGGKWNLPDGIAALFQ